MSATTVSGGAVWWTLIRGRGSSLKLCDPYLSAFGWVTTKALYKSTLVLRAYKLTWRSWRKWVVTCEQVYSDGRVSISNVTDTDSGQYKCLAVSSAYRQTYQWTVQVSGGQFGVQADWPVDNWCRRREYATMFPFLSFISFLVAYVRDISKASLLLTHYKILIRQ